MDKYEEVTFDEWLEDGVKLEIIEELKQRWQNETGDNCVFISATEKTNLPALRQAILYKVREMYRIRYPYKSEYFYWLVFKMSVVAESLTVNAWSISLGDENAEQLSNFDTCK